MVQGKAILEAVQWIIVRLDATMPIEDVAMYTDVGQRTVQKIFFHFQNTGEILVHKAIKPPTLH